MVSKLNSLQVSLIIITFWFLSACTETKINTPDYKNENIIGVALVKNSSLQNPEGDDSNKIVIFDKTIRKIHLFELEAMLHIGKYDAVNPEEDHFLIYQDSLNYFVDLSKKHLSIVNLDGTSQVNPLKFKGTPVSAAFDSKNGYLVMYDNLQSIGLLSLRQNGEVISSYLSGPIIDNQAAIKAGDINGSGQLILAVESLKTDSASTSTYKILVIDIAESLKQQKLIYTENTTTLTSIAWLAPTGSTNDEILVRSSDTISLVNLKTNTTKSVSTTEWVVEKYSKIKNPHIIMRKKIEGDSRYNPSAERKIYYAENGTIKSKSSSFKLNYVLNSHLDLAKDSWSLTTSNYIQEYFLYNAYNEIQTGREFTRYRFSDLLSTDSLKIDDKAIIEISNDYLFSLFPSELGFATRTDLTSLKVKRLEHFNIKDLN